MPKSESAKMALLHLANAKRDHEKMELPIKFPSEAEVIAEDVARFRALSGQARLQAIRDVVNAGAQLLEQSPNAAFLRRYADEQEKQGCREIKEFIARHGG
jgi:hypothetical protein